MVEIQHAISNAGIVLGSVAIAIAGVEVSFLSIHPVLAVN